MRPHAQPSAVPDKKITDKRHGKMQKPLRTRDSRRTPYTEINMDLKQAGRQRDDGDQNHLVKISYF